MQSPLPFPKSDAPLNILVVDDQEFDRKMIVSRLREVAPSDTVIVEADSGEETINAITTTPIPFDSILLDMNLPDIHGVDLTTMILGLKPELSIVMITVEADMDKALKCLKAGAQDFLIKGEYSNISLYRSVRYAMERHKAALENFRLNQALERERELSAAQKEFIHLVSHEFRTPIAIISGATQLLSIKAPELAAGAGAPQFGKISSALSRLVGLLDNVLRLSIVEEGKEVFAPAMFDMNEAIRQVTDCFEGSRIECKLSNEPMHYYGDQRLLEYALHNVLSNALKFSPEDSKVDITLQQSAEGLMLEVIDRGAGMSEEAIARAGEKFHRDPRTSHIEGTGLGLHLAQRFLEYHQSKLVFTSEIGKGTTVQMLLPYATAAGERQ